MPDTPANPAARILYADDTAAQRYAVSRMLRRAGFQVTEAETGRKALELMATRPDLVVLDVNLPDISGLEVCRQIKLSEANARTPVLQVSATLVSTEARVAGLEGGADAYLVQPIDPEELIATVRALIRVRKAEEALWQSRQQYALFFEANPLACWAFDISNLKLLAVNAAGVEQYGYTREEFLTLTVRDIYPPEEMPSVSSLLSDDGRPLPLMRMSRHRTKSGKLVQVEAIWAPLELNGREARLVIVQDMTQRLELQEAEQKEQVRRLLLERVLLAQEDERRRIARELHDEAGQLMTSLLVGLRSLSDARRLTDAREQAKRLREIASDAISELGRLARGLHSSILDDLGLETALRRYADDFSQNHHVRAEVDFGNSELSSLTREEQLGIYRIIQEALTNVARHAHARRVLIRFHRLDSEMRVTVQDDGQGLSASGEKNDPYQHIGIEGMRQRAAILRGSLQVSSEAQKGVTVELRVPLRKDAVAFRATG